MATSMGRAHLHLPLTLPTGDLLAYADVTLLDPVTGTPTDLPVYRSADPAALAETMPITFTPGIVNLWCDQPARFDLRVDGPDGYSVIVPGADLSPDPKDVARSQVPNVLASERAESGQVLLSDGSSQSWGFLNLVAPHQHDGLQVGSTVLGINQAATDADPDQTWVGAAAGSGGTDQSDSSALGANAVPTGSETTALGQGALGSATDTSAGDRATAVGQGAWAQADSVSLGDGAGQNLLYAVSLPYDTDDVLRVYATTDTTSLRQVLVTADAVEVGSALPVGTVDAQMGIPIWLRGDLSIPGTSVLEGDARLCADITQVLSAYGADGSAQVPLPPTTTQPAMASLVQALQAYGLLASA
jgi:hypothetical protein